MSQARQGILSLPIKDRSKLYAAYMPFVTNGGLFIPTTQEYRLGDEVFMLLTIADNKERLPVVGKVIWITPKNAQGNKAVGIGVQFSEKDDGATRAKIEEYLGDLLEEDRPTHTM